MVGIHGGGYAEQAVLHVRGVIVLKRHAVIVADVAQNTVPIPGYTARPEQLRTPVA